MPLYKCPECCRPTVRFLPNPSDFARVHYYLCDYCKHVWNISRGDPDAPRDVNIGPVKKKA